VNVYVHVPPLHDPGDEYTRLVFAAEQCGAGGVLHVTPMHGSFLHMLFAQPNAQNSSWLE
jgi:hypothetical protein